MSISEIAAAAKSASILLAATKTAAKNRALAEIANALRDNSQKIVAANKQDLAEAQKRTELRVEELAEAQKRTELRVEELAEAQKRTEQRIEELVEAQKRTEQEIRRLADKQNETIIRLDRLVGEQVARRYRERAYAYLGSILGRVRVVSAQDIRAEVEPHLSEAEMEDLALVDVLVSGQARRAPGAPEIWLALEASSVVDRNDVKRALRRAALLRRAGYIVVPTVAGEGVTQGGEDEAREGQVLLLQNGRKQFWEDALAQALAARSSPA